MLLELIVPFPATEVTVWAATSLLVHVTVLFTPITTVTVSGAKPGALAGFDAPLVIETAVTVGLTELDDAELDAMEELEAWEVDVVLGRGVTTVNGPDVSAKYVTPTMTNRITANDNMKPPKSPKALLPLRPSRLLRLFFSWAPRHWFAANLLGIFPLGRTHLFLSCSFAVGDTTRCHPRQRGRRCQSI